MCGHWTTIKEIHDAFHFATNAGRAHPSHYHNWAHKPLLNPRRSVGPLAQYQGTRIKSQRISRANIKGHALDASAKRKCQRKTQSDLQPWPALRFGRGRARARRAVARPRPGEFSFPACAGSRNRSHFWRGTTVLFEDEHRMTTHGGELPPGQRAWPGVLEASRPRRRRPPAERVPT